MNGSNDETRVFLIDTEKASHETSTAREIVPLYHPGEPNMMLVGACQAINDISQLFGASEGVEFIQLRDTNIAMLRHDNTLLFGVAARAAFTSEHRLGALLRELRDTALFYAGSLRRVNVADLVAVLREFDCDALREFGTEAASLRRVREIPNRVFVQATQLLRLLDGSAAFDGAAIVTANGGVLAELGLGDALVRHVRARVLATVGSASSLPTLQFLHVWPRGGAEARGLFVQSFQRVTLAVLMPLALLNDKALMRSTSILTADALYAIEKRLAKLERLRSESEELSIVDDGASTTTPSPPASLDVEKAPVLSSGSSLPTMASESASGAQSAAAGGAPLDSEQRASARAVIEFNRLSHALTYNRPSTQFVLNTTANHALFASDTQVSAIVERKYYAAVYSKREFEIETHFQSNVGFNLNQETFLTRIDDVFSRLKR